MITDELIKELKGTLKRGEQKKVADLAKVNPVAVSRFLNGEKVVSDDKAIEIIESIEKVVKARNKKNAATERKIKSISKIA